jgi:hypothetical protein
MKLQEVSAQRAPRRTAGTAFDEQRRRYFLERQRDPDEDEYNDLIEARQQSVPYRPG